jgi:hypothetical protein
MATNIELEKQIIALKSEVTALKTSSAEAVKSELDALKKNLTALFEKTKDAYDLGRNWRDLTYVAPQFVAEPVVIEPKKASTRDLIDAALSAAKEFGVQG